VLSGLWAAGLFGAAVWVMAGRGRAPLELIAVGCLIAGAGCTMLALAFFPRLVQELRALGWLVVGFGCLLAVAVLCSLTGWPPQQLRWFANASEALNDSNVALDLSLVTLTCSSALILTRLLSNQASRTHFEPFGAVQAVFLMFWRQHRLIGWLALALAAAHSVYFLILPRTFQEQWTGIAAIVVLGVLGLVGLVTSYRARLALWIHRGIAVAFGVALTLHWPPILYLEAGALLLIGVTALLNLKLASAIVRTLVGAAS
jgi:hypothetical protein